MNYGFKKGYSNPISNFEADVTVEGQLAVSSVVTGTNLYADGTPVRVEWTDVGRTRVLYSMYRQSGNVVCFDHRVYTGGTISGGTIYEYAGNDVFNVDTFTMQSEISVATYSLSHIPYYANVDYSIRTPRIKGDAKALIDLVTPVDVTIPADNAIVFVDRCDEKVYAVTPTIDTINSVNNVFSRTLDFQVNKR